MAKKPITLDDKGFPKFGMRDKLAYAAGDFGCNMSFSLKSTVQTFWLAYMMMETGLLSILLLLVQVWDAINDPLIGAMIDNDKRRYRHGKFKSYIFIGACGLLVAGAAVFLPLPNADTWLKAMLFVLGYIVWDACYTVANVPYGSMLSLVTDDMGERAQLSTWRSVGSIVGNMAPMVLLPLLIWEKVLYDGTGVIPQLEGTYHINPLTKEAYQIGDQMLNPLTGEKVQVLLGERVFWVALLMGVLGFIAFLFMLKNITIRTDENAVKTSEVGEKTQILKAFGSFMKNRPAVGATMAAMATLVIMNCATTANTIMFATYFGQASLSGVVQVISLLPTILFMPFIKKLVNKYGKKEVSVWGSVGSLVAGASMFIFPTVANKSLAMILYIIPLILFGFGMGVYTCVSWAMMGDAIDYNEWLTGKREEGTVYSLHSFFRKLIQGAGPSTVLVLMGILGYTSELGPIGQGAQTAHNMCWLVAGLFLFSAILQFVGLAFVYNLDKKTTEQMNAELAQRHTS